ncbi:hypothetical protein JTB14_030481 [Gonioctena quinquepunctata]|nr:hypothetical protein JTB14_030481 [Gonioctena quinquepunctata]
MIQTTMANFRKWLSGGDSLPEDDHLRGLVQIVLIVMGNKTLKNALKITVGGLILQNIMFLAYLNFWSPKFEEIMKMLPLQIMTSGLIIGNSVFLNIICYFMIWITSIMVASIVFVTIYACFHLNIQFLILNDRVEKFNRKHSKDGDIHNFLDQKRINKELRRFLNHYLALRSFRNTVNKMIYWPLISIILHTILLLGCIAIDVLSERFNVLLQLCHWYRWNRENKRFLLIFLAATQEPLTFTSSGLIDQNRMMMLRVGN